MHTVRVVRRPGGTPVPRAIRLPRTPSAHAVRAPRRHGRTRSPHTARRWRQRREKGQVAAVATILGLLIVVTFIANYLSTTLPSQMAVNDTDRDLAVQNQIGRLAALLGALTSSGKVGLQVSQPIQLGTDSAPPFAGPDGAVAGPLDPYSNLTVAYTLVGSPVYSPPSGGVPNSGHLSGCTFANTSTSDNANCAGGSSITWNFSESGIHNYNVTYTGGGNSKLNLSTSYSTITVSTTGGALSYMVVIGSHDTINVNAPGGLTTDVIVFGLFDNLTLSSTANSAVTILVVGNHDNVVESHSGTYTLVASMFGSYDSFTAGSTGGSGVVESVYYTGYNVQSPTATCPQDNLSSTDTVAGGSNSGTYTVTYNNTAYSGTATVATYWHAVYRKVTTSTTCAFWTTPTQAFDFTVASGLIVHLSNTYTSSGDLALEDGMVVDAQGGGIPLAVDPPPITFQGGAATIVLTSFASTFGEDAGVGTAVFTARMVSDQILSTTTSGYSIENGTNLVLTIHSPFAAAWMNYFAETSSFVGLATCSGPAVACSGPYSTGGPIGTVVLTLPATTASIQLATFVPALS